MHRALFHTLPATLLLLLTALPAQASQWQFDWDWAVSGQIHQLQNSDFIQPNNDSQTHLDGLLDVQIGYGQWSGLFALYSQDLYQSHPQSWFEKTNNQWIVREIAWQGEVEIGQHSIDLSLGKMRLDYGVSYGYRPLDMFKPYRQNPIGLSVEEGATVATLSKFDGNGEWSLLYTNSHWSDTDVDTFDKANQQQGIGLRRYALLAQHEYQLVAYYDDVRQGALGGSWVSVIGDAWEFHSEALWQHKSVGYELPNAQYQAVDIKEQGHAWQALAGFTYTSMTGHSLIGEYWYDSRAWSHTQWQQARSNAKSLQTHPATASLVNSYAQGLNHYNLTQHSAMLHWSWDTEAWLQWQSDSHWHWLGDFTPKLDLLMSPQDGGIIATQWLTYQWIDSGEASVDLEFTARFLAGKSDSAYAQINDRRTLVFTIKGKF
ncbi:hypothetical protein VII00023_09029 [Vibrio ichthyoenteri ATCC 700023]|uniref:Beta-lactamase n=1 Tax=Vibrio ichthyoenteri ATCC 700023 TaxID=870968 RepID=F9S8Q5_9VIBR|nr:hypothetical protein [Vibrio ichthyoenteri]EGU29542.1 hypothetical protein VII00023_09029 [Vibrio ichthyoenteri ATCC 700023]